MKDHYKLKYIQVMAIMYGLNKIRNNNPQFSDEIAISFENQAIERTTQIAINKFKHKIFNNDNYYFSKAQIDYLISLTNINIFSKDDIVYYKLLIEEKEKNIINNGIDKIKTKTRAI